MPRPAAAAALAAAALLCLAGLAAAQTATVYAPEGNGHIGVAKGKEDLFKQLMGAMLAMSDPSPKKSAVVIASTPPANTSASDVANTIAAIVAGAVQTARSPRRSLGDPKVFPYPDGSGRVALYRMPRKGRAKGTCIFVHGCKHDPYSWFYKSPRCPLCTGLPEEVSHSKQCLANGYAVLALMSLDRQYRYRCFASSGPNNDHPSAAELIRTWAAKTRMTRRPMYMFGVSSGASFAIKFPGTMRIHGVISEVNMPWEDAWGATNGNGVLRIPFPPTVFYMMKRDKQTKRQIQKAITILNNNGVPADYVYIDARPVTPEWLSYRSVYISPDQSRQIQKYLIKIGVLDAAGNVLYDVRVKRKWIRQLPKYLPWLERSSPYYNLISDESQIWQALNVAWSWHEIVSDPVTATLKWLEKKGRANLNSLVAKYNWNEKIACLTEYKVGC